MHPIAKADRLYVWHPFTQMRDWAKKEPIIIAGGKGSLLFDIHGKEYLDANSSIWTNIHGHNHPKINAAINRQLQQVAHTSALGLANVPASLLAAELVDAANPPDLNASSRVSSPALPQGHRLKNPLLSKVFYSDDGSTATEVALKLAYEFSRRTRPESKPRFLSLSGAYHGDTIGAVSMGHIDLFHKAYDGLLFKTDQVRAPYCYRCPSNKAGPERADARTYRQCRNECLDDVEMKLDRQARRKTPYAAFMFEPVMQGAAGMIAQPQGYLRQVAGMARSHGTLLIADEVMTGFGRTGFREGVAPSLFASHQEGVQPDFLCLAKAMTGGYLPMAATLTTRTVFDQFLGKYEDFKTFFHGHSFTGNQLGAAASLASMKLLRSTPVQNRRIQLQRVMSDELASLWSLPNVGDIRQEGLVAGIELVKDWRTRTPFDLSQRVGIKVCEEMASRGILTRPIGSILVLMPPYCTTPSQLRQMVAVMGEAIQKVLKR